MSANATGLASRFEGRLFSAGGRLHLVIDVDTDSGFARVSYRGNGEQKIVQMPISELGARIDSGASLQLDELNGEASSERIQQKSDGWFFSTREGLQGPFASKDEANSALNDHIVSAQSEPATAR